MHDVQHRNKRRAKRLGSLQQQEVQEMSYAGIRGALKGLPGTMPPCQNQASLQSMH